MAKRLSGGTIRIETRGGGSAIVDYERRLVDKVRDGEADLASVGARAWDRMGVTSLQALVAPFLIDSLESQRRVLESPITGRMLTGLEPLGLVGLAVLPGPLRRPLGLTRPLVGPRDYAGATIGVRYGRVAQDTLKALGATPKGYRIGVPGWAGRCGARPRDDRRQRLRRPWRPADRERRPLGPARDDRDPPRRVRQAHPGAAGGPAPRRTGGDRDRCIARLEQEQRRR